MNITLFSWDNHTLIINIHVQPNAKKTEIIGIHGNALKIKLHAPPVDGQANQALIKFFAEWFDCPQRQVEIIKGQLGRQKTIRIKNIEQLPQNLIEISQKITQNLF